VGFVGIKGRFGFAVGFVEVFVNLGMLFWWIYSNLSQPGI
jgi:hypothetical protein